LKSQRLGRDSAEARGREHGGIKRSIVTRQRFVFDFSPGFAEISDFKKVR
jgi:hypothetical protein